MMIRIVLEETKLMTNWDVVKIALFTQLLDIVKLVSVFYSLKWFENWWKTKKESKS